MKKLLLSFLVVIAFNISVMAQTDLIISEYVEGSGNNKALELYNPTPNAIDLSNYEVWRFSNGDATATDGGMTTLEGTIEPYGTFLLINGQTESTGTSPACDPALQALVVDETFNGMLDHDYPAPTYMNGNDVIALIKNEGGTPVAVDLLGQYGLGEDIEDAYGWTDVENEVIEYNDGNGNPVQATIENFIVPSDSDDGSAGFGPYWLCWTRNHSMVRKSTVISGVTANPAPNPPNVFDVAMEWDTLPGGSDIWSNLGTHDCVANGMNPVLPTVQTSLFPNPVDDYFTVTASENIAGIEILTAIGQVVYSANNSRNTKEMEVILRQKFHSGIYLVKINFANNDQAVFRKIYIK